MQDTDVRAIIASKQMGVGVEKYNFIMQTFPHVDVSTDDRFQDVYRDFYQIRRFYSQTFCDGYFDLLEMMKKTSNLAFDQVLPEVVAIQGSFEISFASKLLHTISPQNPIWDSVVTRDHFHIKAPTTKNGRLEKSTRRYEQYKELFYRFLETEEAKSIIAMFDNQFPGNEITDVKKLDFVLWRDKECVIDVLHG